MHKILATTCLIILLSGCTNTTNKPQTIIINSITNNNQATSTNTDNQQDSIIKPPIVDHFACSDYCPGPKEQYMVKVYQGITDETECAKLGGQPSSYTGWGTTKICLIK